MSATFKDYFSDKSPDYRLYRPTYPPEVFTYLKSLHPGATTAWDCACGSGQASEGLAGVFERVIATDASAEQIAHAPAVANVLYRVAPADESQIGSGIIDVTLVAQALHWFHTDTFYEEVRRVTRPPGVFAVLLYGLFKLGGPADAVVERFYHKTLDGFWPDERRHVDEKYEHIALPFRDRSPKEFEIRTEWTLRQLMGFFATWSAVKRYYTARGIDPLPRLESEIRAFWGDPETPQPVTWPLTLITAIVD